jgi:DNA-binding beta-propeller fold protein YncE
VGDYPYDLEYNPSNGYIYVAHFPSGEITVISGITVIKSLDAGSTANKLEYNPSNKHMYVAN